MTNLRGYEALQEVAVQLIASTTQGDLLKFIVHKAVELLECDAGTLYLKRDANTAEFAVTVNHSVAYDFERDIVPISGSGIAAYVFQTGTEIRITDAYQLPHKVPYRFDDEFDRKTNYRTRSILALPLVSSHGEMLGVLQLINRKNSFKQKWPLKNLKLLEKMPSFSNEDATLMRSFAALAAASIEKATLYQSIDNLFKGFIRASVQVIEERDPATKGHSERVAVLSVELARQVSQSNDAEVRHITFSDKQIEELQYASLLHDFGKVSIRESVLLKESKLYEAERMKMRSRFDRFCHAAEILLYRDYLSELEREKRPPDEFTIAQLEKRIREKRGEIEAFWKTVMELNQPTVVDADKTEALIRLQQVELPLLEGKKALLLEPEEVLSLSIRRGSLSTAERLEVENHVTSTFQFLQQIPWTHDFQNLPEIAYCHHEKLDGSGYPRKLKAADIPVQSRIMAICDIFDALIAADRPYKKALPTEKALVILEDEAGQGKLDTRLLKVFIDSKVFRKIDFTYPTLNKKTG